VDTWQAGFASNLLDAVYHDMERWSFTFQILAFVTRAKTWQEVLARTNHNRVVLERSIFTDRHVFATNMHQIGAMTETEWQVYCGLWDFLASNYCVEPDAIVYLRTPAEECRERITERDRSEETGIGLDYLKQLEALHDNWLLDHPRAVVLDGMAQWTADDIFEATRPLCDWDGS
jgi:deoxyadenosine/deoxycytidine kinase